MRVSVVVTLATATAFPVHNGGSDSASGRTAICLVGQLRSIDHTGPSIRQYLLEHLNADAFVVALTEGNKDPFDDQCSQLQSLGPRVQRIVTGAASQLLDPKLMLDVQNAPFMNRSFLVQKEPKTHWARRFAEQFLARKLCRDLVVTHEKDIGEAYQFYGRVRLDTLFLEPFPRYFFTHIAERRRHHMLGIPVLANSTSQMASSASEGSLTSSDGRSMNSVDDDQLRSRFGRYGRQEWEKLCESRSDEWAVANRYGVGSGGIGYPTTVEPSTVYGVSVVPIGEDYGLNQPLGLMDKLMFGDTRAFETDASVWRTIVENSLRTEDPWLMEDLNRDHNALWGVEVRRMPLSYLILKEDNSAKYPSELHFALKREVQLLDVSPELCGDLGQQTCRTCSTCGIMPESARQEDPGFCTLISRCNLTYTESKRRMHRLATTPRCAEDGTVFFGDHWIQGTARCFFDSLSDRLAGFGVDAAALGQGHTACPASIFINDIASGKVTKSNVELVVSSYNANLDWTKPWHPLRTVYRKGPRSPSVSQCELLQSSVIELPNYGRESHSYLYHIVTNYDSLADRTVFMQDREPSCGFFLSSGDLGDHLMMNVSLFDYLDPSNGDTFMPLTMKFDGNLSTCSLRSTFADLGDADRQIVPRPVPQAPAENEHDFWLPWEHNDFQAWIYDISAKTTVGTPRQLPPDVPQISYHDFFLKVFDRPPPAVIYFAQGGQFAASRQAIRRTPREKYKWVMQKIEMGHEELVYYCEAAWFYFMHGVDHPMISLDERRTAPPRWKQAHFLSHLPTKTIISKFTALNMSEVFNATEANFSHRSWMRSLSGTADISNPWSAAYFQRLAHSFVMHESSQLNPTSERNLEKGMANGHLFTSALRDTLANRRKGSSGAALAHSYRHHLAFATALADTSRRNVTEMYSYGWRKDDNNVQSHKQFSLQPSVLA